MRRVWALVPFLALSALAEEPDTLTVVAEVKALRDVRVPAEIAGRVLRRPDDESRVVRKGDVVVQLDDVLPKAAYERAKAAREQAVEQLKLAEIEYNRDKKLAESGSVVEARLDATRSRYRQAMAALNVTEALLRTASIRLEHTRITAPFDGRLVRVYPETGEYLQLGSTAFRVIDDSTLRVIAYVSAEAVAGITPGAAVLLTNDNEKLRLSPLPGRVFSVAPAAEGKARTFRIESRFARPAGALKRARRWRAGMVGQLTFRKDER